MVERAEEAPRVSRPGAMTPDLTIGVVGPHDLVERVMLMGHAAAPLPCRLVAAAYRDEQEAADKVTRLGTGLANLRKLGLRPLLAGLTTAALVGAVSLALVTVARLMGWV